MKLYEYLVIFAAAFVASRVLGSGSLWPMSARDAFESGVVALIMTGLYSFLYYRARKRRGK